MTRASDPRDAHDAGDGHWTEAAAERVAAGSVLGGKYRLVSEIGRGGMGSVWRAEHLAWEAPVALKLMNRDITARPEAVARFEREVRLAAGLRSPHVVQVLDHGLDEVTRTPFIVMELLEGESLARRLKRAGPLSPAEMFGVFSQLVRALTRAHSAGIVHRDLKPDNVFLVRNEEESLAKVLDFGVAKWTAPDLLESGLTRPGSVVGTPYYMSPEQIQGSREIDHRADLWALAAIACECLTGRRPFEAPDFAQLAVMLLGNTGRPLPSSLGPVPPSFDAWFLRATNPDISRRFQTARDMGQTLASICDVAPSSLGNDVFPETRELPARRDAPSMAPVSNTSSSIQLNAGQLGGTGLFEGGGLWQRPMLKLVISTVVTTLVVTGGLAFWLFGRSSDSSKPSTAPRTSAPGPTPVVPQPTAGPIIRPIRTPDPEPSLPVPNRGPASSGLGSVNAGVNPGVDPGVAAPGAAPLADSVPPTRPSNDDFDPEAKRREVREAMLQRPKTRARTKKPKSVQSADTAQAKPTAPSTPPRATPPAPAAPDNAPSLVGGRRIRTSL